MDEGQRDLVLRIASKILRAEEGVRAPVEGHDKHCKNPECRQCSREIKRLHFEMVMIPILCVIATCGMFFAPTAIIQVGAALALWRVGKALTRHFVS